MNTREGERGRASLDEIDLITDLYSADLDYN
jgi:hypothetical protein